MFGKDRTAVAATGSPMYVAGRKAVKMSEFLICGDNSSALRPLEMT
jgi:hypothetical protein